MTTTDTAPVPIPVPAEPPPGYWQREGSHNPLPLTPFTRCLMGHEAWTTVAFADVGLLMEKGVMREIGGWPYARFVPLGDKAGPPPPRWLLPLLLRVVPAVRKRIATCVAAVRSDVPAKLVDQWYDEWRDELFARIVAAREVDLAELTDDQLDQHLAAVIALARHGGEIHFRLHVALAVTIGSFAFTCKELLGWDDQRSLELMGGTSTTSTQPAHALTAVVTIARSSPEVRRLLETGAKAERVLAADREFARAFADNQRSYGCRALTYDLGDPTWAEQPELTLGLIREQLAGVGVAGVSAAADRAATGIAEARRLLATRTAAERDRFERVLARAVRAYPVREENEFFTISVPFALVRFAALEIGRRLAERGQIPARDDVFQLEAAEASAALRDGSDLRALIRRRHGERMWVLAHPGPPSYGEDPGPPPPFDALPDEARLVNQSLLWYMDHSMALARVGIQQSPGSTTITGVAAAPGSYRGPVRVIRNESEFDKLRAGDVLVCPATSATWSALFPIVGALVTDTGGILSHPAIIAREFGICAVVATGNATAMLRDGQVVTVDGDTGVVRIER